jgi:hypothetical protein
VREVAVACAVVFLLGLAAGFGFFGPLAVTCTQNCTAGVSINFTTQENGLQLNLTDTSTCSGSCNGHYVNVTVGWGDGSSNVGTNGGNGWSKLPTKAAFTHLYGSAGTYKVADAIVHETCSVGPRGGVRCAFTTIVGQQSVKVSSTGSGGGGGGGGSASVNASFKWTVSAFNLTLHDTSVVTGAPNVSSVEVAWGDGAQTPETMLGFSVTHPYTAAADYNVTETVLFSVSGSGFSSVYTTVIAISTHGNGSGGGNNSTTSHPLFAWNALVGLLTIGFGLLTIASLLIASPRVLVIAGIVLLSLGTLIGYAIGGAVI